MATKKSGKPRKKAVAQAKPAKKTRRAVRKKTVAQAKPGKKTRRAVRADEMSSAAEPLGACRWTDKFGAFQCQSPVTKAFCDKQGGEFEEDGRCP